MKQPFDRAKARQRLSLIARRATEDRLASAVALAVVAKGQSPLFVCQGRLGLDSELEVTTSTRFRFGSLTKVVTGMGLLLLRDRGLLGLDDPVAMHCPELTAMGKASDDSPAPTLRHLVTHSAGLVRDGPLESLAAAPSGELRKVLTGLSYAYAPATKTVYSNLGAALAGLVIESVTGKAYKAWLMENLLRPMGLEGAAWSRASFPPEAVARTYFGVEGWLEPIADLEFDAGAPSGGLMGSIEDLAKLAALQIDAWPARNGPDHGILSRGSLRESHVPPGFSCNSGSVFGVFWKAGRDREGRHLVQHSGATLGHSCSVRFLPDLGLGVVGMANAGAPRTVARRLVADALDAVASKASVPRLSIALEKALERFQCILDEPCIDRVADAFSQGFLQRFPAERIADWLSGLSGERSECAVSLLETNEVDWARWRLQMPVGVFNLSLWVGTETPFRIQSFDIEACDDDA